MLKRCLVVLVAIVLSGCASKISSDITRFNDLPPAQGEAVAIVATDAMQEKSMEFARYAALVREKLAAYGYSAPTAGSAPAIVAELNYGVGQGAGALRDNGGSSVSVGLGVGGGGRGGGVGVGVASGFNLSGGDADGTFVRRLSLNMTRVADGKRLFEGRVSSVGKQADLNAVMPYLVDALFTDFPGVSGETRTITRDVSGAR